MEKTKIEWCDSTWNPVTGCKHGCEYCYARSIAHRFDGTKMYPNGFEPMFWASRLGIPGKWKEPKNIFVCSMADLFGSWVPDGWIKTIFEICRRTERHNYLFLTKNPERFSELVRKGAILPSDRNFWFGTTAVNDAQPVFIGGYSLHTFLSIEPIMGPFDTDKFNFRYFEWVIIGAETGRRKEKVIPERKWIEQVCSIADRDGAKVFMKDSLVPIVGEENMRRELPDSLRRHDA